MKRYSKEELQEMAAHLFEELGVTELHATTDGQFFVKKSFANAHAEKMKLTVYEIHDGSKKEKAMKLVLTQEDIDNNPELVEAGCTVGQEIGLPIADKQEPKPESVAKLAERITSIEDIEELNKILSNEEAGANRSTAIKAIKERIEALTTKE